MLSCVALAKLTEGRAASGGVGAFASHAVRAGDTITTWAQQLAPASSIDKAAAPHTLVAFDGWAMPPMHDVNDRVNHSCEPTAGLRFVQIDRKNHWAVADLIALRDIAPGDEVTFDYASVIRDEAYSFACQCGRPGCRRKIGPWATAPSEVRERLRGLGMASPAVLETESSPVHRPFATGPVDPFRLDGRRILVTGGTGGIGSAALRALARAKAACLGFTYFSQREPALALARELETLGARALAIQADTASETSIRRAVQDAAGNFAGLDGIACLAGAPFDLAQWNTPLESVDRAFCEQVFRVDALGTLSAIQAATPALAASRSGRVVLCASTPPLTGDIVGHAYLLAKAAVIGLGRAAAQSLGPKGIHVNTIALGHVETKAMDALAGRQAAELQAEVALKRGGTPEEIATKIVFLLGPACEYMTGATLVVDGGYPQT